MGTSIYGHIFTVFDIITVSNRVPIYIYILQCTYTTYNENIKKVIFAIVNKLLMYYMLLRREGEKYNNEINSRDEKFISAIDRSINNEQKKKNSEPVFASGFLIFSLSLSSAATIL